MEIEYSKFTSQGGRENNEDSIGAAGNLFIVADGLGGHSYGEIASKNVVEYLTSHYSDLEQIDNDTLHGVIAATNKYLWDLKREHPEYQDMASTVVAAFVRGNSFNYLNVGDSRMYFFRKARIFRQSRDHSVTQLCVDTGQIRPRDMRFHEDRNKLTRVLGLNEELKVNNLFEPFELQERDAFLLCTDGFWEYITERQMMRCLRRSRSADQWMQRMLKCIDRHTGDGNDNLSAICAVVK